MITRDRMWRGDGVRAVPQLEEAFVQAYALSPAAIFVAGGGEIYRAAWPRLTRLEITEVDQEPAGDVTFPDIDPGGVAGNGARRAPAGSASSATSGH